MFRNVIGWTNTGLFLAMAVTAASVGISIFVNKDSPYIGMLALGAMLLQAIILLVQAAQSKDIADQLEWIETRLAMIPAPVEQNTVPELGMVDPN
ncbi:hypothetical protein F9L00_03530 [Brucella anthropi]|uniref:hypothetical protein n=1 Tax=Brucella/Ochrobactrum group TaxID=2826938 RepID=UPI00124D273F|nr:MULTISPECIES: hypothetical protein [Brucella/Ochrobactrum group]KAB2764778.1 hypothetical protein F9K98_01135 [Brucella anthropi]KAB2782551.1 hypothetical protein F9L00_03530 [Brucella anthropi]MCQ9143323.1 hypothetical protein [Ochrobactrum sp. BTU2]UGQ23858.1 hypothetical protein LRL11_16510 [Brucella anthropi]